MSIKKIIMLLATIVVNSIISYDKDEKSTLFGDTDTKFVIYNKSDKEATVEITTGLCCKNHYMLHERESQSITFERWQQVHPCACLCVYSKIKEYKDDRCVSGDFLFEDEKKLIFKSFLFNRRLSNGHSYVITISPQKAFCAQAYRPCLYYKGHKKLNSDNQRYFIIKKDKISDTIELHEKYGKISKNGYIFPTF